MKDESKVELEPVSDAILKTLVDAPFIEFVENQCARAVDLFNAKYATFNLRATHMRGNILTCEQTDDSCVLPLHHDLDLLKRAWKASPVASRAFRVQLEQRLDDVHIATDSTPLRFTVEWMRAEPRGPTLGERLDRLEQLILALPPIAGGRDYLAAARRFDEHDYEDLDTKRRRT